MVQLVDTWKVKEGCSWKLSNMSTPVSESVSVRFLWAKLTIDNNLVKKLWQGSTTIKRTLEKNFLPPEKFVLVYSCYPGQAGLAVAVHCMDVHLEDCGEIGRLYKGWGWSRVFERYFLCNWFRLTGRKLNQAVSVLYKVIILDIGVNGYQARKQVC